MANPYQKQLAKWRARRREVRRLRDGGMSFAAIGRKFGVTRERARQLYNGNT